MKKKKQKPEQIRVRCQYCGRMARLHPASYVYGSNNLDCRKKKVIQVNMSVEELCNPKGYYSIRGCSQKDRATLERMFGKTAEFRIEDIQSVSYGGIVLYENVASRNAA